MKGKYESNVKPYFNDIKQWLNDGLIIKEIAKRLGINKSTLHRYMNEHEDFCNLIKRAKQNADYRVEDSLFKRACGYKIVEKEYKTKVNKDTGEIEKYLFKEVHKEIAPDTTAQIFWLKNRNPLDWRDKKEIDIKADKIEELLNIVKNSVTNE